MIKKGEIVKYIGKGVPKYTGQMLEVNFVNDKCVSLLLPKVGRHQVAIENGGVWKQESLLCGHSEVEEVNNDT